MMTKKRDSIIRSAKFLFAAPLALALLLGNVAHATPSIMEIDEVPEVAQIPEKTDKAFFDADVMPQYPGGEKQMLKFISKNLVYPKAAQKAGISGRVVVRFIVKEDGSLTDLEVMRKLDPECDKETMRVIEKMPKWTPGKNKDGEAVAVYFNIPVVFKLNK